MGSVIRSPKDLSLGVIYLLFGAAGLWIARDYPFGSGARMGAGYFPTIISGLLLVFGLVSIGRSLVLKGQPLGVIGWKAMALIFGAVVAFGALIEHTGLIVGGLAVLYLSATASEQFRFSWRAMLGALALVACCALLFINALGLPMPAVGPWLSALLPSSPGP